MRKILNGQESIDKHNEFFTFSPERQRLLYYSKQISYDALYSFIYEDDTKLCLGNECKKIRYNNNKAWSHVNPKNRTGFTYDKTTKKFSFWYKSIAHSFNTEHWSIIFKHTDNEWLEPIFEPIASLITPTMFGKIFSKKISDPIEFCKLFIKSKPWLKNTDMTPDELYQFLIVLSRKKSFLGNYIQIFSVAKSVTPILERVLNNSFQSDYFYHSVANNALALDIKIDFTLSKAQLKELNEELIKQIDFNYSLLTL